MMMNTEQINQIQQQYPNFCHIIDLVKQKNPLQGKRIKGFIFQQNEQYWRFCEELSEGITQKLFNDEVDLLQAVDAYNELCLRMLKDQIQFRKTGTYVIQDDKVAKKDVYDNSKFMWNYMVGLMFTQMLWPNHYQLFQFFSAAVKDMKPESYFEVGAGHGLFAAQAFKNNPQLDVTICDISQASIDVCRKILNAVQDDSSSIKYKHQNFFDSTFDDSKYDFIAIGEVLEHVTDAPGFLKRIHELLAANGKVYMSTCANCPAPDHVYHFHNINEIRDLIRSSKFVIDDEIFLPAEKVDEDLWEEQLVTINYAAILRKRK